MRGRLFQAPATVPGGGLVPVGPVVFSRFSLPEYVLTGALAVTDALLYFEVQVPDHPRYRGGVWFDDAFRDLLRIHTANGRRQADLISDYFWVGLMAVPVIFDAGIVAFRRCRGFGRSRPQRAVFESRAKSISVASINLIRG